MKILIIGDDSISNEILSKRLKENKEEVTISNSVEDVDKTQDIELIFITWDTEKEDEIVDFIYEFKKSGFKSSIIVLSKDNNKHCEISALNGGADDYCLMPIKNNEIDEDRFQVLMARVEARLRFGGSTVIKIGDLLIDPDEEKIFYQGKEIELKGKPFEVLTHLAKHKEQVVSKEQLLDAIWEEPELVTPNVIEVAINQIRQKMDKPLGIGTIETVRRRGYRFCFLTKK